MAKAAYGGVDTVARMISNIFGGVGDMVTVDGVARTVNKGYGGVNGVARQFFLSGVPWKKYSCDRITTTTYTKTSVGVGATGSDKEIISTIWRVYPVCDFSSTSGWAVRGYTDITPDTEISTLSSKLVGKYIGGDATKAIQITAVTNAYINVQDYLVIEFKYEVVGCATKSTSISYEQGDTEYGTVTAPEGELPEDGILREGSPNSNYCVLYIDGTYYYYVKEE